MINFSEIVFRSDKYESREKMFEAISKQLMILMENEYVCKIFDEDADSIVIQFEHDENKKAWGFDELHWLTPEEVELIEGYRCEHE